MKILIVNKFLYPNGGSETYIFEIGKQLSKMGHQVQYFGMEHEGRIVGNAVESYTAGMDFHTGKLQKLLYPFRIIYSGEARRKIRRVLDDFAPDVVHLNNFNFQLTPSVIYEVRKYEREKKHRVKMVYTAHDYQLVCPNHLMMLPDSGELCSRCLGGHPENCMKYHCIHGSKVKSILGSLEGMLYRQLHTYRMIDRIICPSHFMKEKLDTNADLAGRTVMLHNFVNRAEDREVAREDYVLYFGRFCREKGTGTLLEVCRSLPEIPFVFAGSGPMEEEVNKIPNVQNRGFLTGKELEDTIRKARFFIFPSEWYENCPFAVMEAQSLQTPVIASDLGGTPELVQNGETGELYAGGDQEQLRRKIQMLWEDRDRQKKYADNCRNAVFDSVEEYCGKLVDIYRE